MKPGTEAFKEVKDVIIDDEVTRNPYLVGKRLRVLLDMIKSRISVAEATGDVEFDE